MASLPVIFGAILAGAIAIDYGVKNASKAFENQGGTGSTSAAAATGNDARDVKAAAAKWGVPSWILWGVYGLETSHGSNVSTSSAGAQGKMQFIPSTAAQYGYPMTNRPSAQQSAQQFDAAAHYLHDLFAQTGSWASAITHYSGGGYGLSQVQAQSGGAP